MAEDKELSQLEAVTNPSANDLMYIVSGGNSRKIPYGNVFPKDDYYTKTQMDTALAGKEPTISVTANRALVSDANGKVSASNATSEEVDYLSGVTGAIQTQINGKQNTLAFDSTPTAQSNNPVTSGGIKSYVDGQGAKTASGNPITLTDAEAMNADHVVATITPTQTGSGTPSPSNVRPFTGFSSVDLNRYNKNICEPVNYASISDDGITYTDLGYDLSITNTIKLPAGTYTASILLKSKPNTNRTLSFTTARYGGTQLAGFSDLSRKNLDQKYSVTFSVEEYTEVKGWFYGSGGGTFKMQMMIEANDQATTYEPYQGQTYIVQLGDTYYGATLDVTSGKLMCEWLKHSLTSNDVDLMVLQTASGYRALDCSLTDLGLPSVEQSASTDHSMFDCFENVNSGAGQLFGTASIYWNGMVYFWDNGSTYANKSSFQQGLKDIISNTGISFIYKLATPIEIQLTPQQIALLENNNTITTNVSSLDITYQTNNGIGDTASALDKRVTSLESKVPQPPTTDGTYKLTVTVASGEPTYSWESAT